MILCISSLKKLEKRIPKKVEFNVREKFDLLYILLNDWPYNGSSTYGLSE